jgi:hypothetical protein
MPQLYQRGLLVNDQGRKESSVPLLVQKGTSGNAAFIGDGK